MKYTMSYFQNTAASKKDASLSLYKNAAGGCLILVLRSTRFDISPYYLCPGCREIALKSRRLMEKLGVLAGLDSAGPKGSMYSARMKWGFFSIIACISVENQ